MRTTPTATRPRWPARSARASQSTVIARQLGPSPRGGGRPAGRLGGEVASSATPQKRRAPAGPETFVPKRRGGAAGGAASGVRT
ncbi:MAG: hypothetical protein QM704_06090 [Anaeromyxobacteraceae bacterium]